MAGGDIQKDQLVCSLCVVDLGALHRVPCITKLEELGAFDHAAFFDVEAGNDAFGEHEQGEVAR
jgi:hypothetical protein